MSFPDRWLISGGAARWLGCLLGALLAMPATANSLRCDNTIIREGQHMYDVSAWCGAPLAEFSRVEYLTRDVFVYVDEWVYQFGANRFERLLRFENGRLRRIELLAKPDATRLERFRRQPQAEVAAPHQLSRF